MTSARSSLAALADLALPASCASCRVAGAGLCRDCLAGIRGEVWPQGRAVRPRPCPQGLPEVWAGAAFAGALAAVVAAYKDDGRRDLAPVLAGPLSLALDAAVRGDPALRSVLAAGNGPVLVVPVPSSAAARRRRGDFPLGRVADLACRGFGPGEVVVADALRLRRRVADQAGLSARERQVNLEHAMQVRGGWEALVGRAACVLVDDVMTTGATLVEAARALRSAGARAVVAATVCATERRLRAFGQRPADSR
jgi:predicted amidophosphoribosyltransferase